MQKINFINSVEESKLQISHEKRYMGFYQVSYSKKSAYGKEIGAKKSGTRLCILFADTLEDFTACHSRVIDTNSPIGQIYVPLVENNQYIGHVPMKMEI